MQNQLRNGSICAGHDVSSGGLITSLLEMCFADNNLGAQIDLSDLRQEDSIKLLLPKTPLLYFKPPRRVLKHRQKIAPYPAFALVL